MIFLFRSDVGRRPTRLLLRLFARCRSLSDAFPHVVRNLGQQIAQVVLFLFLHVLLFQNCRIIISNPPTSLPPKTNKRLCGWQKNWIGKCWKINASRYLYIPLANFSLRQRSRFMTLQNCPYRDDGLKILLICIQTVGLWYYHVVCIQTIDGLWSYYVVYTETVKVKAIPWHACAGREVRLEYTV
jgi:hypothetical protein